MSKKINEKKLEKLENYTDDILEILEKMEKIADGLNSAEQAVFGSVLFSYLSPAKDEMNHNFLGRRIDIDSMLNNAINTFRYQQQKEVAKERKGKTKLLKKAQGIH